MSKNICNQLQIDFAKVYQFYTITRVLSVDLHRVLNLLKYAIILKISIVFGSFHMNSTNAFHMTLFRFSSYFAQLLPLQSNEKKKKKSQISGP